MGVDKSFLHLSNLGKMSMTPGINFSVDSLSMLCQFFPTKWRKPRVPLIRHQYGPNLLGQDSYVPIR